MTYIIRRRNDDKYFIGLSNQTSRWDVSLSEAVKTKIKNKAVLTMVLEELNKQGYSNDDLLIYKVVNSS